MTFLYNLHTETNKNIVSTCSYPLIKHAQTSFYSSLIQSTRKCMSTRIFDNSPYSEFEFDGNSRCVTLISKFPDHCMRTRISNMKAKSVFDQFMTIR